MEVAVEIITASVLTNAQCRDDYFDLHPHARGKELRSSATALTAGFTYLYSKQFLLVEFGTSVTADTCFRTRLREALTPWLPMHANILLRHYADECVSYSTSTQHRLI
jgi:hypothetical protein